MNHNSIIRKNITEDKIFKEPKTMQVMWYILLNRDKEQKLKTTYQQITCITGLSKSATEKSIGKPEKLGIYLKKSIRRRDILENQEKFPLSYEKKNSGLFQI